MVNDSHLITSKAFEMHYVQIYDNMRAQKTSENNVLWALPSA